MQKNDIEQLIQNYQNQITLKQEIAFKFYI